ncbi:MAG: lysylphosphatidylglycerol synthase transmembrane domain-containing protein [Pseudomonadota bacterium]
MKRLIFGMLFVLTIATCLRFFTHFSGGVGEVFARIASIPALTWAVLAMLTSAFYALDWIRFRSVLSVLGYRLRWRDGIALTCVSYFVTSLTPSAELHTPAMVYMLSRRLRVPVPQALAASVTKSIYMTLWICLVAYLTLFFNRTVPLPALLRDSLPVLTLPLLFIALLLGLIAFFPAPLLSLVDGKVARWPPESLMRKLAAGIAQSAASIAAIGSSRHRQHALCHAASITFLLTYVAIGSILASALGFSLSLMQALTIFSTSLMIAYLAPVPGAIGVTEVATSYMLDPRLTPDGMAVSLTLRILCWYLVAFPGTLVLLREFARDGKWSFPRLFK